MVKGDHVIICTIDIVIATLPSATQEKQIRGPYETERIECLPNTHRIEAWECQEKSGKAKKATQGQERSRKVKKGQRRANKVKTGHRR